MRIVKCDKCREVFDPGKTRKIAYTLCEGPSDLQGLIHWQGLDVYKTSTADLCGDCWKDFVFKINDYFKQKK